MVNRTWCCYVQSDDFMLAFCISKLCSPGLYLQSVSGESEHRLVGSVCPFRSDTETWHFALSALSSEMAD